jgi:hypothetical protein
MANSNIPRGLIPYRQSTDGYETGGLGLYCVPASYGSAIYVGDPVIPVGTADANGIPIVQLATAGSTNYLLGPMVSIAPGGDPQVAITRDMPVYHPASTLQYILVAHNPNALFEIMEDSVGGALTSSAVWQNANLVAGAGSIYTGYSGWMLQSSSAAAPAATEQVKILRLLQEADNVIGVNAKWLVRINLHAMTNTSGI